MKGSSIIRKNSQIVIHGARVHNLKNVSLEIPRDQLIVLTGLSGSGKSSLAFDTIYAEGQRRYVESLSAYARQFLGRMVKPDVDLIKGIPPAIAIEQKVNTRNPRSTVGTSTEIYDYLKLLYARIGRTISPVSQGEVKKHSVTDVTNSINHFPESTRLLLLAPLQPNPKIDYARQVEEFSHQGISRIEINGKVVRVDDVIAVTALTPEDTVRVVADRLSVAYDADSMGRYADSVQLAFRIGSGECIIKEVDRPSEQETLFSNRFELDGFIFEEPNIHMFSFNNPLGACPVCEGYGNVIGIDPDLVIPNKGLSVYQGTVACWRGEAMGKWNDDLIYNASKFNFPVHKPYAELTDEQRELLWKGNRYFHGIDAFFEYLESKKYKIQHRVMLARYRGKTVCPECRGARLRKEASWVKVGGRSIQDLVLMPVTELRAFITELSLSSYEKQVAGRILTEIRGRLEYLCHVGLGYLTLNRLSSTLSGGESQRINLATTLGSSLVGSLYILDEPSIGLHPRDTHLLVGVLRDLQRKGNTVMVVEHEEEIIRAADRVIDIGPGAGSFGGNIVFQGSPDELSQSQVSLTGKYLSGSEKIEIPANRRKTSNFVLFKGARENNLKNLDVKLPLNVLTVVSGVSGSGKSSLVRTIIYHALGRHFGRSIEKAGDFSQMSGDMHLLSDVEFVDQNPIGKSSRSNPVTYVKAYDEIRKLYAELPKAKTYGFKPSHFSFNVDGGRCEECQGEGEIKVEMQFMADVHLLCESCHGQRFKGDVLEVNYHGKNIFDILEMTIDEAMAFFGSYTGTTERAIVKKIKPLADVGLGYVKLGQSSSTLSGGESQRVKLASFLGAESKSAPTLFIFDEPTTGLHFDDIRKLLHAMQELIRRGHTMLVVEHNLEVIKSADWLIELGPEGGDTGGFLVYEGTPEGILQCLASHTAPFLKGKFRS